MSWLEFVAFLLTVEGIYLVGSKCHLNRNRGFLVGSVSCIAWIVAAISKGLFFWWGATNLVLLGVYLRGYFRTRPFADDDKC